MSAAKGPQLPAPAPEVAPEAKPFWDATAEGRLVLPRCDDCAAVVWYPRALCPDCGSTSVSWFEASGRGSIHSFTVTRRGQGAYRDAGPYVLAYVELEEGPRVLTNVVDADPESLEVGQAVTAVFSDTGQGTALLRFRPA